MDENDMADLLGEITADAPEAPATETETPKETETNTQTKTETQEPVKEETAPSEEATAEKTETETPAEPSQTETKTEPEGVDWKSMLPPPPPKFDLTIPQADENGEVDPEAYTLYVTEKAKAEMRNEIYQQQLEDAALTEAERILPELKTNPVIATIVRNTHMANIVNGQESDIVEIAKGMKELFASKVATGAQNAKTSIEIQQAAGVETGASQTKATPTKTDALAARLDQGDEEAMAELIGLWDEEGKI